MQTAVVPTDRWWKRCAVVGDSCRASVPVHEGERVGYTVVRRAFPPRARDQLSISSTGVLRTVAGFVKKSPGAKPAEVQQWPPPRTQAASVQPWMGRWAQRRALESAHSGSERRRNVLRTCNGRRTNQSKSLKCAAAPTPSWREELQSHQSCVLRMLWFPMGKERACLNQHRGRAPSWLAFASVWRLCSVAWSVLSPDS